MSRAPTLVTVETAAGRSAVAVVSVTGPSAASAVDSCFLPAGPHPPSQQPLGSVRFGRWIAHDGEEVVVCRRATPHHEVVEVHCHGGTAAVRAVVNSLVERGCRERVWKDSFAGSHRPKIAVHASFALRQARTERTAAVLLDQLEGALENKLREITRLDDCKEVVAELHSLLEWSRFGQRLTQPWRIVFAGAPNVGKSSLINVVLGYARSIVFDQPGTTRDVVTAEGAIEGWPVLLLDTAGLRQASDEIEEAGVRLAREQVSAADLVVEVRDTTRAEAVDPDLPEKRLVVWNKVDLAAPPHEPVGAPASAVTGEGIDELLRAISDTLVPEEPPPGLAIPFTLAQVQALQNARQLAASGDAPAARQALQALLAPA